MKKQAVANVVFAKDEEVIVITKEGMSIHFPTKDISPIGRVTAGVKAVKLAEGDYVIGGYPIKDSTHVAVFSEKGLGKKVKISEMTIQARGGKGLLIYKPNSGTGKVAGATLVKEGDNLLLVGRPNSIYISESDVPELSRTSMGNIMIKDSNILSVVK